MRSEPISSAWTATKHGEPPACRTTTRADCAISVVGRSRECSRPAYLVPASSAVIGSWWPQPQGQSEGTRRGSPADLAVPRGVVNWRAGPARPKRGNRPRRGGRRGERSDDAQA